MVSAASLLSIAQAGAAEQVLLLLARVVAAACLAPAPALNE